MKKIKVSKECFCEHYLHEIMNYPREGLVEKKFKEGEEHIVLDTWNNFYGSYYRVTVDGKTHDISKSNAILVDE